MADLIELIFAEDGGTLVRKDTKRKVDAKPVGEPNNLFWEANYYDLERIAKGDILKNQNQPPKNANAYVLGKHPRSYSHDGYKALLVPVQFYLTYSSNCFRELYEGIVDRIEQHPEVELRGQFVDHSPFADVNVNLYVVPHNMIRDASKLNEILHSLTPEGIEPTRRMDAFVQDKFHVLSFGVLGFEVEIGQKTTLKTYTGMMPEELLRAIDESSAIEKGVYKAGIRLKIFPHKKFVFQNANGIWVSEKYSCGFFELNELEKKDNKS